MKINISLSLVNSNVKESTTPTDAVHFGDLGVGGDTMRSRMDGGRGTGFFGTGTYFLSNAKSPQTLSTRPKKYLNLDHLKLYVPKSAYQAYTLHDLLKYSLRFLESEEPIGNLDGDNKPLVYYIKWYSEECFNEKESKKFIEIAKDEITKERKGLPASEVRTVGTRIMQRLGYDGIDVRHTELDRGDYGSVVYTNGQQ